MRHLIACAAIASLIAMPVRADAPVAPPTALVNPFDVKSTSDRALAGTFALGAYKGDTAVVGLSDVPRRLGVGQVQHMAGGGESLNWVCYDLPSSHQRVWLSDASGTSAGAVGVITVQVKTDADRPSSSCPALPAKFQPLVIQSGLRIGMTRAELLKITGAPARQANNWLVFHATVSNPHGSYTDGLSVRLEGDRVAFLSAVRIANN